MIWQHNYAEFKKPEDVIVMKRGGSKGPPGIRLAGLILLAAEPRQRDDIAEALLVCVERENWWKATTSGI